MKPRKNQYTGKWLVVDEKTGDTSGQQWDTEAEAQAWATEAEARYELLLAASRQREAARRAKKAAAGHTGEDMLIDHNAH